MKHSYQDIRSRITDPIQWYDSNGVPRYVPFAPDVCSNPYAREVVLMEIACRHCDARFHVEMQSGPIGEATRLAKEIETGQINYGEPPCHDCPGDKVNSQPVKILGYYVRAGEEWKRETIVEVKITAGATG